MFAVDGAVPSATHSMCQEHWSFRRRILFSFFDLCSIWRSCCSFVIDPVMSFLSCMGHEWVRASTEAHA
jgi:hypothetical protein